MATVDYITPNEVTTDTIHKITREFTEFLNGDTEYLNAIRKLLISEDKRLIINLDKIREKLPKHFFGLLNHPTLYYEGLLVALKDIAKNIALEQHIAVVKEEDRFFVGLTGSFGRHLVTPRTLKAHFLNNIVCIEGIVSRCSNSRPKVSRSVHYCQETKQFLYKDYRDSTNATAELPATTSTYPTEDENGNPLITEFGLSIYRDHQTLTIQEMPEKAPPGQLPRSIDVLLDDDLVDRCKPGDRVRITGLFKSLGSKIMSKNTSTFKAVLVGNNVRLIGTKSSTSEIIPSTVKLTDKDIKNITDLAKAKKTKVVNLLSKSLMPSIHGMEYIKSAILMMLLGGCERTLQNGGHIRGDINVLMVGDPSTAKSQVLRYVLKMANFAVATTGRGSSGVGLTAAVTTDQDTGERRLEAGAMVLADRGVVCIDEFDKMSDADRVAIHEVMEQQTVTISKAGIHTSLNARCSVLAAANPIFGQYDESKEPHRNISLPDSLLSRFDLLFIVLDKSDATRDREVAQHVLTMHRYRDPNQPEADPNTAFSTLLHQMEDLRIDDNARIQDFDGVGAHEPSSEIYQKHPASSHNANLSSKADGRHKDDILTSAFLKKYIFYAKSQIQPVLKPATADKICQYYGELRAYQDTNTRRRTFPVTTRTLETIIRLSTAHAKARLSNSVTLDDAKAAYELLRYALFKEVDVKKKKVNKKVRTGLTQQSQLLNPMEDDEEMEEEEDDDDEEENRFVDEDAPNSPEAISSSQYEFVPGTQPSHERVQYFTQRLSELDDLNPGEPLNFNHVLSRINNLIVDQAIPMQIFGQEEARAILEQLMNANKCMVSGDSIFIL